MAQTNFTPILLYSSSTPTNVPLAANLTNSTNGAEIAINIADKNLFFKDSGGTVNTVPIRQSSTSSNGWLSSTDWNTFNGKAPATSGTSILYGNGSGGFSNVTIGTGITFAGGTLSATGSGGTVTSVTGTSPVVSSGGTTPAISLATAYGDTLNPYASKTANYILAAPNGSAGVPTFRALVAADLPSLSGTYIPYTGASSAIDLNAQTVTNIAHLGINTTSVPTILIRAIGDNNSSSRIAMRGYSSNANSSSIRVTKFRGTFAAPQAPQSGDSLGKFELAGYGTTASDGYPQASYEGIATENWGATARGTKALFYVTPNTTITQAVALTLDQDKSATFASSVTATSFIGSGSSLTGVVTSVTGTAPVVSSGGTTPAISMAAATGSVNGYLTSTDWTTFNSKQPAGSYLTAVSIVSANGFAGTSSGGTTPALTLSTSITGILKGNGTAISAATSGTDYAPATSGSSILYGNGAGGFSNVTVGTGLTFVGGTLASTAGGGTVTSVAALTLGTTGTDLSSTVANSTTTPVITLNVPTASATNRGALSAADWTTFNGKAPALTYTTNYVPYGQGTTTPALSSAFQFNGTTLTLANDASIHGLTVGLGANSVAFNTAVGISALASGSLTGTYNTAVGYQAGNANTSGAGVSAFGFQAGKANTTGVVDAFGFQSFVTNTTGTANAGFGYQSGQLNVTGNGLAFFGAYAGSKTTVNDNTACGFTALGQNTTGYYNTAVGGGRYGVYNGALGSNTTGTSNTAVGHMALGQTTTAINNSCFGSQSGFGITSGYANTIIGTYQGGGAPINATGNNYVVLSDGYSNVLAYAQNGGGWYQQNNSTLWSITSDARIKKNVVSLESALSVILALRPVEFDYIENDKHDIGFIAQEYQKILPAQVSEKDDGMLGLTPNLLPYLVKAIQELKSEFDQYKATHP